jgi:hypothetical protein
MAISKLEAAERQLNCAIRLYFSDEDLLAVHTLSRAAFRVLLDLYPMRVGDSFGKDLEAEITRMGWPRFNRVTNFLKHADEDHLDTVHHVEGDTEMGLGFALILHSRIARHYTPETAAFDRWMKLLNPDKFKLPIHPDPEFEKMYRDGAKLIREDKAARFLLANSLLRFYRERPERLPQPNLTRRRTKREA